MLTKSTPYIKHPAPFDPAFREEAPAPIFRRHFSIGKGLISAKLSYSALGLGKLFLNGVPVSEDVLTSPFSDYSKTLWYNSYDVTQLLSEGENIAAVMLGNGFFNESLHTSWDFDKAGWRDSPKLCLSLELNYADHVEYIESDTDWLCDFDCSPVRFNEMRYGERFDARFTADWMNPEFNDSGWMSLPTYYDRGQPV